MPSRMGTFALFAAVALGALAIFHGTARAFPPPVQTFASSGGFSLNAGICYYDGSGVAEHPTLSSGHIVCGPNTTETHVALGAGSAVGSYNYVELPSGNRLTQPVLFTPSGVGQFSTDLTKTNCGPVDPDLSDGRCTNLTETGRLTALNDILCSGAPFDVFAANRIGVPIMWPDDPFDGTGWNGVVFRRTEEAVSGTGIPSDDSTFLLGDNVFAPPDADTLPDDQPFTQNAYVNVMKPFPPTFPFVSLDTAVGGAYFLGGAGAGFVVPGTVLQKYIATSAYGPGTVNVSVTLWGRPDAVPTNDYLCMDSPQSTEENIEYLIPPTSNGLFPRWTIFTSEPDLVNGDITRILDLHCVGVGTVTSGPLATDIGATDVDDDCLATPTDANDADPDQDDDGLPDSVEFFYGSSQIAGNTDVTDGASDYTEMFQFTNASVTDTDGDGYLDAQDTGADENTTTLFVDDTVLDDNCPFTANVTQLNTDSAQSYHGGNAAWANRNTGGAPTPGAFTLPTSFGVVSIVATTAPDIASITTTVPTGFDQGALVEISGVANTSNTYRQGLLGVRPVTNVNGPFSNALGATGGESYPTVVDFTESAWINDQFNGKTVKYHPYGLGSRANLQLRTITDTIAPNILVLSAPFTNTASLFTNYAPAYQIYTETFTVPTDLSITGAATGTLVLHPATGDVTNPDQDMFGDACDPDDDNDGLNDIAEPTLKIKNWAGAGTTVCVGPTDPGGVAPFIPLDPLSGDSDQDMILDGEECRQSSRPDVHNPANTVSFGTASCSTGPLDLDGCAQPSAAVPLCDPDGTGAPFGDFLYFVGCTGPHIVVEIFHRTQNINLSVTPFVDNDTDRDGAIGSADKDSDADWNMKLVGVNPPSVDVGLQDGIEVRFYGTLPANGDTDTDGCDDAREVGDIDGNRSVNTGDQARMAFFIFWIGGLDSGAAGDETAGNRAVNPWGINFDLNKDRVLNGGDGAFLSFLVGKGQSCQSNRQLGKVIGMNPTKLPY